MLDLRLFRTPTFTGAQVVAFCLHASIFAMFLYLVLYLQNVLGNSPLEAGLRFLPVSLLAFLVAPAAGKLSERTSVRVFLGAGLILVGTGLLLMGGIKVADGWTALLGGFIVAGIGIGCVNPPLASASIGVVDPRRSGAASGINATFRQVGIATGIAGLGALFQARVEHSLAGAPLPPGAGERLSEPLSPGAAERPGAPHRRRYAKLRQKPRPEPSSTASTTSWLWQPPSRSWVDCSRSCSSGSVTS
jgi:predicted MFS family arabinose efflux permease